MTYLIIGNNQLNSAVKKYKDEMSENSNQTKIKEFGVEFVVPADLYNDLTYAYISKLEVTTNKNNPEIINFSAKSFTNIDNNCGAAGGLPALGSLIKYDGKYSSSNANEGVNGSEFIKQLSNYYIIYISPQPICPDKVGGVYNKILELKNALKLAKQL